MDNKSNIKLLKEALKFGQFSDDFNEPLAKSIRKAIRDLITFLTMTNTTQPMTKP